MSDKKKDNLTGNYFSDSNSQRLKMEDCNNYQRWKSFQYDLLITVMCYHQAIYNMIDALLHNEPAECFLMFKNELDKLAKEISFLKGNFDRFYEVFEAESAFTHIKDRNYH